EGVAFVREHRVQFFAGFLARDAARLHTSDGEPEAALVLFGEATAAFHRAGNVPQLIITLASVPALFERLDRLAPAAMLLGALSREPSSFHHVPELGVVSDRDATRPTGDAQARPPRGWLAGRGRPSRPRSMSVRRPASAVRRGGLGRQPATMSSTTSSQADGSDRHAACRSRDDTQSAGGNG